MIIRLTAKEADILLVCLYYGIEWDNGLLDGYEPEDPYYKSLIKSINKTKAVRAKVMTQVRQQLRLKKSPKPADKVEYEYLDLKQIKARHKGKKS